MVSHGISGRFRSTGTDRNRQSAIAFYDLMVIRCRPRDAIDSYTGAIYI